MSILRDEDKKAVQERLSPMTGEVKLVMFTQEMECQYCRETRELLTEVAALSDKISLQIYDFVKDKDKADEYKIDKVPATLVLDTDESKKNLRYYGVPSGYEFASLLDDILMVSAGDSGLSPETKDALANLANEVHMQVFVTPTCPYCPGAVRLAHQMAFESDKVTGDMVEASEFPQLSMKYNVRGVPRTIINEDNAVEGMVPEANVLQEVLKAV